jgi:tRNA-splicing ligase RtcB
MPHQLIDDVPVWGNPVDESAMRQIKNCAKTAAHVALMGDHHKGYAVPIGGVVAYEDKISPSGVGFDIACGNKAVLTDADASDVRRNIKKIMDDVWRALSFGVGLNNKEERVDHELFDDPAWKHSPMKPLKQTAQNQLGTIGSGNHYVDLFEDERERIWIGVHFGSRGLGHKTATHFLKAGGAKDGMDVDPLVLDVNSPLGSDYLACMNLAGRYAYAGRDWVCSRVAKILGARIKEEIHNHHNFAWKERHDGRDLWVVRKGATPAFPGQKGFVGGSMGDISVILEGVDSPEAKASLHSTVHGAGRVMSRTAARGKVNFRTKKVISPGAISREMMMKWVKQQGVELRGAGTDESPHCYKRLPEVLRHHEGTIRILHTLKPLGVAMAGEDEFDPYKD